MAALNILAMLVTVVHAPSAGFAFSLIKNQDFTFGKIVAVAGSPGTMTIGPSGERNASGGIRAIGNGFSPARFTLYGYAGETYSISMPTALTVASGRDHLEVSALSCSIPLRGVVPPGGMLTFTIGGTFTVKANQRPNRYTGDLSVTVAGK